MEILAATLAKRKFRELPTVIGVGTIFWIKAKKEWTRALFSPFVVSLGAGTLERDIFDNFNAQDRHFLRAFLKACGLAELCADDVLARAGICKLRESFLEELKRHDSAVEMHTVQAETMKYIEFLLATASGEIEELKIPAASSDKRKLAAYTLCAMASCVRLYATLGKYFRLLLDPLEGIHPYLEWINYYSSNAFQAAVPQIEDMLDKLRASLTEEEIEIIEKVYHLAMKLEVEFILAQPVTQETIVPLSRQHNPAEHCLMLFSSFDSTCAVVDSSTILDEMAVIAAPDKKSEQNQSGNQLTQMPSVDLRNIWKEISEQYMEEYEQCIESILRLDKAERFYYEGLCEALEQLPHFDKKANSRVVDSGVLKGLKVDDIKQAGGYLILQDGCNNFFQSAVKNENLNINIHVLSYCWCGDIIRSAFSSGGLDNVEIYANELVYQNSLSTGEIVKKVESPMDKVEAFEGILKNSCTDKKILSVYIGCTVEDLLCLLKADIGIVKGSNPSLRKLGNHFGVTFVPLLRSLIRKQKQFADGTLPNWKGMSGVLYTVTDWAEVHAFILGFQ